MMGHHGLQEPQVFSSSLRAVTYGNGYFIAVGNTGGVSKRSSDGITWTSKLYGKVEVTNAITYGYGTFVIVCYSGPVFT